MMTKNAEHLLVTLIGVVLTLGFIHWTHTEENDLQHQREFNDQYNVFSLPLPSKVTFCGEQLPMDKLDVRERLDRELLVNTYWQSNSILNFKRANRWFPIIEKVLAEEGVPDDMKYLALIESGLTNVVSPAGATGFWQFLKNTGVEHDLEINKEVDERYHVEKATRAACQYLKSAYDHYSDWTLSAASYNRGMNGVDKQLERQHADDLFELLLPEETMRYVFRAAAMKEIMEYPTKYGFHIREKDLYHPYSTVTTTVTGPVDDLAAFAKRYGTDYRTLKLLNPWLRQSYLSNPHGRSYDILLPADDFDSASR